MKIGVVGLGQIACDKTMPAIQASQKAELVALSDIRTDWLDTVGARLGVHRLFAEYGEMLAQPDIDIVYVATPNHLHPSQSIQALEAGKHVLCEKPMALNAEDAARMVDAARLNGLMLAINYMSRFHPVLVEAKRLFDAGTIGKLLHARAYFSWYMPESRLSEWRTDPAESGGGPLMDVGVYPFHAMRALTGMRVSEVWSVLGYGRGLSISDVATAVGRLEDGTPVAMESSYDLGYAFEENGFDLVGETGVLRGRGNFGQGPYGSLVVETPDERRQLLLGNDLLPHYYPYLQVVDHLADCIVSGQAPLDSGEATLGDMRLLDVIHQQNAGRR